MDDPLLHFFRRSLGARAPIRLKQLSDPLMRHAQDAAGVADGQMGSFDKIGGDLGA